MDIFDHIILSRIQFALTTMFHISWAAMSVGLSAILVILEVLWLKTGNDDYYYHARFWSKLFFLNLAVGVVSGVPLEFQFGTNWNRMSAAAGGFFGSMLGVEASMAFMLEAGFAAIMFFGWHRVSRPVHFFATCMVALGATMSAFWIMVANSWMHTPAGGHWDGSRYITTDFWAAILNHDMPWGTSHMWVACIIYAAFFVGGLSAWYILREQHAAFFAKTFKVALVLAILFTSAQIYLGDESGRSVADTQPAKLAAMEAHWRTNSSGTGATWSAFAWPDLAAEKNAWTFIDIPNFLSMLAFHKMDAKVIGLRDFPPDDRPPVAIVYYCFRVMAGIGFLLFFIMLGTLWYWYKGWLAPDKIDKNKWLLLSWTAAMPAGWIAIETGWVTREMGRQPWVIYSMLRTRDGASNLPAATVGGSLLAFTGLYIILFAVLIFFTWLIIKKGPDFSLALPGQASTKD